MIGAILFGNLGAIIGLCIPAILTIGYILLVWGRTMKKLVKEEWGIDAPKEEWTIEYKETH